jgi:hypothetical protein
MDSRTFIAMASYVALIGLLGIAAWTSLDQAQADETLKAVLSTALD